MTDTVHHVESGDQSFGSGVLIGLGLLIVIVALLVIFGLPALRGGGGAPATDTGSDTRIPSEVDINVEGLPAPAP